MSDYTKIEWADTTWNPFVGCTRIGRDCQNCYAERMAYRLASKGVKGYGNILDKNRRWNGTVNVLHPRFGDPYSWKKPRRVFVNSMSDFFHGTISDLDRDRLISIMRHNYRHTFMILTKRAGAMRSYMERYTDWIPDNTQWGVSVCDQETAEQRISELSVIKARNPFTRFISYEPALDSLDVTKWIKKLNGIIAGGESGYRARPDNPEWYRQIRDICVEYSVPFFFKQWSRVNCHSHRLLDGEEWNQLPEGQI